MRCCLVFREYIDLVQIATSTRVIYKTPATQVLFKSIDGPDRHSTGAMQYKIRVKA